MADTKTIEKQISDIFSKEPCWMIKPLTAELNYSIPSVRRFLVAQGYYSSFTHNGKWYTLKSIPRFNRNGIWFYQDIGFSKAGSLTNTLVVLTDKSHAGVTAEQLGEILHCRCHTLMVQLCRKKKLQRQKIGRSFIYFSAVSRTADRQRQALNTQDSHPQLPAEIALLILVEFIHNPDAEFSKLAKTIKGKWKLSVTVAQIEQLFRQYSLKKTMLTVV
jgi:predicted transcriptional regulator